MNLLESHCIKKCAEWIKSNKFDQVGLEFPDATQNIFSVSQLLTEEIGFHPIILFDPNRACGNCCIDESTPRSRGVQAIIRYGSTCLTPTKSLPVLHVLNSLLSFDTDKLTELLLNASDGPKEEEDIILFYDSCSIPFISSFYNRLKSHFRNMIFSLLVIPEKAKLIFFNESDDLNFDQLNLNELPQRTMVINNRKINLPTNKELKDYNFVYVGGKNSTLESLQMRFSDRIFYVLDRIANTFTRTTSIKSVMNRSCKIEQVRNAKRIGIVLTLVYHHQEIADRMRKLIKSSKRKCYSYYIGKINEAKLANIVGIDVFVYVGCSESSLFNRNEDKYLYKHTVVPWELEVALNPSYEWTPNFITDFNELLSIKFEESEKEPKVKNLEETNHLEYREKKNYEIVERNPGTLYKLHENAVGEVIQSLSWKGLNPSEESSVPIGTVVVGRSGIAMQYDTELK